MGRFVRSIRIVGRRDPSSTLKPRHTPDPDPGATSFRISWDRRDLLGIWEFLLLSIRRKCVSLRLGNSRLLFDRNRSDRPYEIRGDVMVGFGRDGMRARLKVLTRA
jgi:hypothetical protein